MRDKETTRFLSLTYMVLPSNMEPILALSCTEILAIKTNSLTNLRGTILTYNFNISKPYH